MDKDKYVFISYSSKDNEYVSQLAEKLKENGVAYWKAPEMIMGGSNYAKEIPKAIAQCSVFLLVLSKTSQASMWVEKEIDTAICHKKVILPIRIDDEPLNDLFRFYLNNVQLLQTEIRDERLMRIDTIIQRIKTLFEEAKEEIMLEEVEPIRIKKPFLEKESDDKRKMSLRRTNALRVNKIPIECEFCGGDIEQSSKGGYFCVACGRENFDDFHKIRNYIEKYGPAPAVVISRNTGVSMKTIEHFRANGDVKDIRTDTYKPLW